MTTLGNDPGPRERITVYRLSLSAGRVLGIAVIVGAAYFLTAHFSLALVLQPDGVAAFWPAAGISAGILIALGPAARWSVAAGVIAATIAANLTSDRNIWASAVFALANAAKALITAGLVQHYFRSNFDFDRLFQVLGLLAASIIATSISGSVGIIGYRLFHSPAVPMPLTWWHWFASDVLGIIAVAPLVIRIGVAIRNPPSPRNALEGATALVLLAATTAVVLSLPGGPWRTTLPAALLFPMLLWFAARCPPGFGAAGAFIVSVAVVWTTIFGIGHFGEPSLSISDRLLQAQAIILVVTTGTYVLTALFAERRASAARLANSHMLLERERDSKLLNVEAAVAWIDEIIRRVLDAFREDLAQDSIVMRLDLAPNLPHIEGNVSQLEHVISNLVRNALDAMNATENRPRELHLRTELRGQSAIGIGVQDSGPGIDPTQLSNAFRAFFTTKAHGTGWGWRCAV